MRYRLWAWMEFRHGTQVCSGSGVKMGGSKRRQVRCGRFGRWPMCLRGSAWKAKEMKGTDKDEETERLKDEPMQAPAFPVRPVRLQCIARQGLAITEWLAMFFVPLVRAKICASLRHHRRDRWRVQVKLQSMSFCVDHFASTRRLRPVWSDICRMAFPASSSVFMCNAVSFGWGSRLKRFLTGTLPHTRLPSEANTRDDL